MSKILIVDDSRFTRNRIKSALADIGCEIVEAKNGQEALDLATTTSLDCILTDLLMPEMDGKEFLKRLRDSGDQTPVLIISADIQTASREECESYGISGFLNKPVDPQELKKQVSALFEQTREASL